MPNIRIADAQRVIALVDLNVGPAVWEMEIYVDVANSVAIRKESVKYMSIDPELQPRPLVGVKYARRNGGAIVAK